MISISLGYLVGYFLNEKYQIEYSRFYSPITNEQRDHLNSDPEFTMIILHFMMKQQKDFIIKLMT